MRSAASSQSGGQEKVFQRLTDIFRTSLAFGA